MNLSESTADPLDLLTRSCAAVGTLVDGVRSEQWSAPTPCTDWSVRQVVAHLVGMDRVLTAMLGGGPRPERAELPDDRLSAAYAGSSAALLVAFSRPGVLQQRLAGPLGTATGGERLRIRLYDLLAHGWDVAQATGQQVALPADAAEESWVFARAQLVDDARPGRFAPARAVPDDAPALERLVAFLGRPARPAVGPAGKNEP